MTIEKESAGRYVGAAHGLSFFIEKKAKGEWFYGINKGVRGRVWGWGKTLAEAVKKAEADLVKAAGVEA